MRVKEMHPLCCISLESPGIGSNSPESYTAALSRARSLPASGSDCIVRRGGSEATVAGVLYKWTNYGKGWRSRWFLLRNGVLSYSKIRSPENLNLFSSIDDVRLIGDVTANRLARMDRDAGNALRRQKSHKPSSSSSPSVVHLKV
jgi:oxysterol-binding protein 1